MKMKNYEILALVNAGVLFTTAYSLSANASYKLYKFKKQVQKAIEKLQEDEKEMLKTAKIEDTQAFDTRRSELIKKETLTEEEKTELREMEDKLKHYLSLRNELYEDETEIEMSSLDYEDWFALKKENRAVKVGERESDVFNGNIEMLLEGKLWKAPEE